MPRRGRALRTAGSSSCLRASGAGEGGKPANQSLDGPVNGGCLSWVHAWPPRGRCSRHMDCTGREIIYFFGREKRSSHTHGVSQVRSAVYHLSINQLSKLYIRTQRAHRALYVIPSRCCGLYEKHITHTLQRLTTREAQSPLPARLAPCPIAHAWSPARPPQKTHCLPAPPRPPHLHAHAVTRVTLPAPQVRRTRPQAASLQVRQAGGITRPTRARLTAPSPSRSCLAARPHTRRGGGL